MGAKGSSSEPIGTDTANPFRSPDGWRELQRRIDLLHGMATQGQMDGIIREVQEWERTALAGLEQEAEYNDIMRAQEIFEQLTKEGKS